MVHRTNSHHADPLADPSANSTADPWDCFDCMYCMTITDRDDRRQAASSEFEKIGILDRVTFVQRRRNPTDSEQGIYESHQQCLRQALEENARTIVIFEDDVIFERYDPEHLRKCCRFLEREPDWEAFFLGALVKSSRRTAEPGVLEITYRSLAHAYAVSRPFAERLVGIPWQGVAWDTLLADLKGRYYAAYPCFAFQSDSATDNVNWMGLDRFRRLLGGLKRIQKANEWNRRHVPLLVVLQGVIIATLVVLIWKMLV